MNDLQIADILAWIVLGAIAGFLAGLLVKGDEGLGIVGTTILGIVGALLGGFIANVLGFSSGRQAGDIINVQSIVVAVFGAVIVVVVAGLMSGRARTGGGVV